MCIVRTVLREQCPRESHMAHTGMSRKNVQFTAPREMTEAEAGGVLVGACVHEPVAVTQTYARASLWRIKDSGQSKKAKEPKGKRVDHPEVRYRGTKQPNLKGVQAPSRSRG